MKIETRPIALSMKSAVEKIRLECGHVTASHAFASLFIWQEEMGLSIYLEDGMFAVKCGWRGENAWFFPCGSNRAARWFIERGLAEPGFRLCYMREEDVEFLNREFPGRFQIAERPEDHEYLYDRAEQQELKGRDFSALRNHIHRVTADHELRWEPLCAKNVSDAVAVGYPLGRDMFDLSLAKQKSRLSGLSVYAKHRLICSLPDAYTRINAEEDLGIEGLRMMKRQMRPMGRIKMYEGRGSADGETG